ncbi:MAG: hypothetical protein PHE58_01740 [Candidatus Omnitrophica bacterium]|nr:hypothetical protein [Candidatus Omnitrophota bacterium]
MTKRSVLCVLAGIFLFFQGVSEASTLRINQSKVRSIVAPGGAKSGVIQVENSSDSVVKVKAYLEDWVYNEAACDGTKKFFPSGTISGSASPWISFSPSDFTLAPFGKQTVNYKIAVPSNAQGGHYSVLFFESSFGDQGADEGVGMNLVVRIGTLFYVEPEGTVNREAEINNIVFQKKDKGLIITADFKNTGNVDITCSGTFHVMDDQGMVLARNEFNKVFTFSGNMAKLTAVTKSILPQGTFWAVLTFDLGKALEEANLGRGPIITKEFEIQVNDKGEIVSAKENK